MYFQELALSRKSEADLKSSDRPTYRPKMAPHSKPL